MTNVDWGALHDAASTIGDIPQAGQQGALAGYQLGQMSATRQALNDMDWSNPQSVQTGIGALVKAGAAQQAGALSDLQVTTAKNKLAQSVLSSPQALAAAGIPTGVQPAANQTSAAQPIPDQAGRQRAQTILDQADQAIQSLKDTPPAELPAAVAGVRQRFVDMGVPPERIDSLLPVLPDANDPAGYANWSDKLALSHDYIQALKAHPAMGGPAPADGQEAPAMPVHPHEGPTGVGGDPGPAAQIEYLNNPGEQVVNGVLEGAGIKTDRSANARAAAEPYIRGQAELQYAAPTAAAQAAGKAQGELANPTGTETYYTKAPGGKLTRQDLTSQQALAFQADPNNYIAKQLPADVQAYQERMGGLTAEAKLGGAVAAARKAGENTGTLEDIPVTNPDGSQSTTKMTVADYIHGARTGTLPAGVGVTQSNTQKAFTDADSANLAKVQALAADEGRTGKIQSEIDNANRALATLKGINTNAGTGAYKTLVDGLNAAGIPFAAKDANNLTLYQSSLNQMVADNGRAFPGRFTDKDLGLTKGVMAQLTSPRDAAAVLIATKAATANREKSYLDGIRGYNGYSQRDYDKGFAQSTPGSLFADPAFQNVTVNGKPFVQIGAQPHTDGHVYGVIMPGTKQAQTFLVK